MSVIATYVGKFLSSLEQVHLDDFTDKCHYIVSSGIFAFFSLLIGSMIAIGEPLNCFMPAEFPGLFYAAIC
jgi:hypothetical protein